MHVFCNPSAILYFGDKMMMPCEKAYVKQEQIGEIPCWACKCKVHNLKIVVHFGSSFLAWDLWIYHDGNILIIVMHFFCFIIMLLSTTARVGFLLHKSF